MYLIRDTPIIVDSNISFLLNKKIRWNKTKQSKKLLSMFLIEQRELSSDPNDYMTHLKNALCVFGLDAANRYDLFNQIYVIVEENWNSVLRKCLLICCSLNDTCLQMCCN